MKRDIILSVILHVVVISATLVSSPFDAKKKWDYGEPIRVRLTAAPDLPATAIEPAPIQIPAALEAEMPEIPLEDPASKPEVEIDKPEEEPEPDEPETTEYQPDRQPGDRSQVGTEEGEIDSKETAGGSPFAGATVDDASFNYPYWFDQAFYKIRRNWRNPVAVDGRIVCVVYFQIIKSGRLIEAKIEEPSGIPAYDDACLRAVKRSAPFPPLPKHFREEIVGITLPFMYEP